MKPAPFVHHSPRTLDEAVTVLGEVGHDGKVLAGGQSLIPVLNMRLAQPAHLVDINRVDGLGTVTVTDTHVRVGATVRHAQLEKHDEAYAVLPLLRQALRNVAHPAIRNRGTTVGSIAHADAAGEMPSIAVLTDAVIEAIGPRGRREIAASEFFEGPLQTVLEADEILEAVRFGRFTPGTLTAFLESARRHGDYALAGLGVAVELEGEGTDAVVRTARAAYVSVTDIPVVLDLSEAVAGQPVSTTSWNGVEELVQAGIAPEADIHASSDYRRALAVELTRRALTTAATTTETATTTTEGHA
ncbi:FAD binding domain-containing protein [Knoellia sp. LjRoot47]|uniref:FAD binding domain-containing protein n=1 Tax=Knoellia sp. LjRoot47 TaxID=3342330 RepID=UPI003ED159A4